MLQRHDVDRSAGAGEAVSNEQRYFDALKRIARDYMTPEQLRRKASQYGLSFAEMLEMSYENLQDEAKHAIKGRRRPKDRAS